MKNKALPQIALATSLALFASSCANLTPGENAAAFGSGAGILAGSIASVAGASVGQSIAIGAATGAAVGLATYIISKHQATERQRQIAEERARVYYGSLAPQKKRALKQKNLRYLAVDTLKDENTSPKAKKAVMVWDTQSGQIVGNQVYDVQSTPTVGSTAQFDTYSAEYVGAGH